MAKKGWTIFMGGLAGLVAWKKPDLITKAVDQTVNAIGQTMMFIEAFDAAYLERATRRLEAQQRQAAAAEILIPPKPKLELPAFDSLEDLMAALGQKVS
ncbi:MAG: hypothetical protein IIC33_09800, partial [Chloroflexi bacterium]|nr:hypothetical protein [Chloroflexota bacterium]